MKEKYLLSIVIPTKNREKYIKGTLEQILELGYSNIQIIIQDNSDISIYNSLKKEGFIRENVKYNYSQGIISFVENFNLAVELSDGEYLCLIGDDDGITKQIMDVTIWAKQNNIEAIKPELNAMYFWPDSGAVESANDNGCIYIKEISGKLEKCSTEKGIRELLEQGCQNYLLLEIVKLYHGIVKKDSLIKVKKITGKYFGGLSPDIYIAVALSLVIKEFIKIDFPLTIPGVCNKSGSSDSVTGKHTGKLKEAPHFRGHKNYVWEKIIPNFYSVETIWCDSALAAIKDMKRFDLLNKLNLEYLTLECYRKYPDYKNEIFSNYQKYFKRKNYKWVSFKNFIKYIFNKIRNYILRKIISKEQIPTYKEYKIENISNANKILQDYIEKSNFNIKDILKKGLQ